MSLKPRYSLLTLLVLTALVAGGVKWWQGPHRVALGEPPTTWEQTLLARARWSDLWSERFVGEYVYQNGWAEPKFLALIFRPRETLSIYVQEHSDEERKNLMAIFEDPSTHSIALNSQEKFQWSKLRRIVYTGPSLRQPPAPSNQHDGVSGIEDCYFLTAAAQIYRLRSMWMFARVDRVQLSEIADPIAREMLASELALLSSTEK